MKPPRAPRPAPRWTARPNSLGRLDCSRPPSPPPPWQTPAHTAAHTWAPAPSSTPPPEHLSSQARQLPVWPRYSSQFGSAGAQRIVCRAPGTTDTTNPRSHDPRGAARHPSSRRLAWASAGPRVGLAWASLGASPGPRHGLAQVSRATLPPEFSPLPFAVPLSSRPV